MARSKYAVGIQQIRKMTKSELEKYVRLGGQTLSKKYYNFRKQLGKKAVFSEFVQDFEELTSQVYGEKRKSFRFSKNAKKQDLQQIAYAINRLAHISETPKQVEAEIESEDLLKMLFESPEKTAEILGQLDPEDIVKIGRENDEFIRNTIGSNGIKEIVDEMEDPSDAVEYYKKALQKVSDELDLYDPTEKEEALEEWVIPDDVSDKYKRDKRVKKDS